MPRFSHTSSCSTFTSRVLKFFCVSLLAALVLIMTPMAAAQQRILAVGPATDQLVEINPISGATVSSTTITLAGFTVTAATGLAVQPGTGTVFALLRVGAVTTPRRLVTLNTATGVATDIGPADDGSGLRFADIAFTSGGTLFGVTGDGGFNPGPSPETLFTINTATAVPTLAAALGNGNDGEAIAFNPGDGLIYHASGRGVQNVDEIFETIDPAAPLTAPVNVALSVDDWDEQGALTFWGNGLFLAGDLNGNLWVVSTTGRIRFLTNPGLGTISGLVVIGTPPACNTAGNICGAANIDSNGPSVLYSIAQASGTASMIGPIGFERVGGMAFSADGNLWGVGEIMDGTNTQVFLAIDPTTGFAVSFPTPTGLGTNFDISFRRSDGALFAIENGGRLSTINTATGAGTIGPAITVTTGCCGNGLAFDFADTLFTSNDTELATLDTTTAVGTIVGASTFAAPLDNFPRVNAMDFDPITGVLFGHAVDDDNDADDSQLVTIDPASGTATIVGPTQDGIDAIAIAPSTADLVVTKVDNVPTVAAVNDVVTYTITVTNNGPGIASGVQLTDTFSGVATYVAASVTTDTGTCNDAGAPTITCDLGGMADAAVATISFQVTATAGGSITNDVDVTTGTNDPNAANNTAQVVTGVGSADVSVTKVDAVDPVTHPAAIVYTITVTNNALTAAEVAGGVVVTDTFTGAAVTFGSAVPSQGTCNAALPVVCNLGDIAGMGGFATVVVTVNSAAVGTVTDTATVTTATTDPTPANNTAVQTTVVNGINLVVTKTDSPDPMAVGGGNVTYLVTVSNATGTIPATLVALTDNFTFGGGAAATFVSATPSQGTCTPAFPAVPCDLGTIAAGANATVSIVVTPTVGGTITNTASATAAEVDPVPADNTNIVATTTVAASQDFTITVSPNSRTILPGQTATFTVTITPAPFIASLTVDCSHSIPLGGGCPGTLTLNPGNLVATGQFVITTSGFFVAQHRAPNQSAPLYAYWLPATAGFGALGLVLVGANRKRLSGNRRAQFLAILSLLLAITLLAGCPLGRDREDEGTPGGTYSVTFTGTSGAITHSVSANVVVQGTN